MGIFILTQNIFKYKNEGRFEEPKNGAFEPKTRLVCQTHYSKTIFSITSKSGLLML